METKNDQLEIKEHQVQHSPTPPELISQAISQGLDIDKLERLFDLQEKWNAQQAKKAYYNAMASFQSEKPILTKSEDVIFNGKKQYSFMPLDKLQRLVDPILSKHGLSYRWIQANENEGVKITCVVTHKDGHSEETSLFAAKDGSGSKNSIQSVGSTNSYLKRYTLEAALGLSSGKDDDGTTSGGTIEDLKKEYLEYWEKFNNKRPKEANDLHPDNWKRQSPTVQDYKKALTIIKKKCQSLETTTK